MHAPVRVLVALAIVAVGLVEASDADACSCVKRTFAEHAKNAKRVVLARAGEPVTTGKHLKQAFDVLALFKGPDYAPFVLERQGPPPCASSYVEGALTILFITGSDLDPCHGNLPLSDQVKHLRSIVKAAGTQLEVGKAGAVEAALRAVLPKYLRGRPRVSIRHPDLVGGSFEIDKTRLTYAKTASPNDIEITTAFTVDQISFVEGRYATKGLRFTVVLLFGTAWEVFESW